MSKNVIKRIFLGILIALVVLLLSAIVFFVVSYNNAHLDINKLTDTNSGVKVFALTDLQNSGNFSYNSKRKLVDINELNDYTLNAFIDIEDKRFYSHHGYDIKRIVKSLIVNIATHSKNQGASTITQQLIKNTILSNKKSYERKFNEVLLSIKTEKNFTKQEILNMYLNTIYFGSNAYGIENASQTFFDKSAKDLTINESAVLAGIIKSPKHFSPKSNNKACFNRKNLVLKQMYKNGHLTKTEYETNIKLPVEISNNTNNYENSYYQQAIIEACSVLNIQEKELIRDNYQIITYLDIDLQNQLENIFESVDYDCDKLSVVANNKGEVLAYLGESLYDLTNIKRSPASTLKPLSVYLPALEKNLIFPSTPIKDEKTDFNGYSPRNFNDKYHGWVSSEYALANSLNVPAVKIMEYLTPATSCEFLAKLGITLDKKDENLSLALGGLTSGLPLLKLLECYTVLQNYGQLSKLKFVDKILDKNNRIVYQNPYETTNVSSQENAFLVTKMLHEAVQTGSCKQLKDLELDIASKTGTNFVNNNNIDLYNVAYTPNILTLSWLGDVNNQGLNDLSSSFHATKINKEIFNYLKKNISFQTFEIPNNIVELNIDMLEYDLNHKVVLATEKTAERYIKKELFNANHTPIETGDLYYTPNLDFKVEVSDYGAKITLNTKEIFDYKIIKMFGDHEEILDTIEDTNNLFELVDEKIFSYDRISYKVVAKQNYTDEEFVSNINTIFPKEYLLTKLKNNETIYQTNTKKRWYV